MAIIRHTKGNDQTSFYIDFRDQHGKRRKEWGGSTLKAARKREAEITLAVRAGTYEHPRDRKQRVAAEAARYTTTFGELCDKFLADYVAQRRSNSDYPCAVKALRRYFGEGKLLASFLPTDFDDFIRARRRTVKDATINHEIHAANLMFRLAGRWGLLAGNPASGIHRLPEPTGRTRYLTREEFGTLIERVPPRLRPMLTVAVNTGLRLKELTELRWDDISGALLYVPENTKTGMREVPLNATARAALDSVPRHARSAYVFHQANGEPYADGKARHRLAVQVIGFMHRLGLTDASLHTLRHTCASWMVMAGVDLYTVGRILGHTNPKTTQRYAHLAPGYLAAAVAVLDAGTKVEQWGRKGEPESCVSPTESAACAAR